MCRVRLDRRERADLFGQRNSFDGRRQAKLGGQYAAAGFVGVEGGAALIGARQHAHQLAVGGFAQRVVGQQPANGAFGLSELAGALVPCGELFERRCHLHVDMFALNEQPLVELRAIAERELVQELAAHQFNGLGQPGGAFGASIWVCVRMGAALFKQITKARDVQLVVAERVEAQREPIADEVRLIGRIARLERLLQLRPGDAQVVLGSGGG
jgi:hypothetical protein